MYLIDFLNEHPNDWKEVLAAKPYCIDVKQDGEYFIFKYSLVESDLSIPLCRECRGCICRKNDNGSWVCVCRSLDKFGNWGESYADTTKINWSRGVDVQEKVDGSLIRVWYDRCHFHISTNGTIDAFKAECGDTNFGNVFMSVYTGNKVDNWDWDIDDILDWSFNHEYVYWFELVHPQYNPIVVRYSEPAIYYLGARNIRTMKEAPSDKFDFFVCNQGLKRPRHYHYECLDDVLEACHRMGEDEEGYVCVSYSQMENGSFLRIKVKGDEYLRRHHLRGNGPLTVTRVCELYQTDSLDDFVAYFPEHREFVDKTIFKISHLAKKMDIIYNALSMVKNRKDFALYAKKWIKPIQSYLFARLDNKVDRANTYFKNMKPRALAQLLDVKEIGVK